MDRLSKIGGKCFFLGSSNNTLEKIKERAAKEYPEVQLETFPPPFKPQFSETDSQEMLRAINAFQPEVLFVGMTAPKQEKWAAAHFDALHAKHICSIGAVFDFYAGTVKRAPYWMIKLGFEWLYRFLSEPTRLWRRYIFGNITFVVLIILEKVGFRKE